MRGNNSLLKLLRVKTKSGRKRFKYQGALIYNALSADVRDESSVLKFRNKSPVWGSETFFQYCVHIMRVYITVFVSRKCIFILV